MWSITECSLRRRITQLTKIISALYPKFVLSSKYKYSKNLSKLIENELKPSPTALIIVSLMMAQKPIQFVSYIAHTKKGNTGLRITKKCFLCDCVHLRCHLTCILKIGKMIRWFLFFFKWSFILYYYTINTLRYTCSVLHPYHISDTSTLFHKCLIITVESCFYISIIYIFPLFATFFQVPSIPCIHNIFFTSTLHFKNFKHPTTT
jgi:hypothetical protein